MDERAEREHEYKADELSNLRKRNRELTERLEAAERLVAKWREQDGANAGLKGLHYVDELEAAIGNYGSGACSEDTPQLASSQSAAPVKPVAVEERTTT